MMSNGGPNSGCRGYDGIPSGIVTQPCLLLVQIWISGRNGVVSSSVPARIIRESGRHSGLLVIVVPQSGQKPMIAERPLSAVLRYNFRSPVTRTASISKNKLMPNAPYRRWHWVQWQTINCLG